MRHEVEPSNAVGKALPLDWGCPAEGIMPPVNVQPAFGGGCREGVNQPWLSVIIIDDQMKAPPEVEEICRMRASVVVEMLASLEQCYPSSLFDDNRNGCVAGDDP